MRRWLSLVGVAFYAGLIVALSSQSTLPLPETNLPIDKVAHLIEYGGLGTLLFWAHLAEGASVHAARISAVVLASLFGMSDEVHQYFVPGRSSEVLDWVADTSGAFLAAWVWGAISASFARRRATSTVASSP